MAITRALNELVLCPEESGRYAARRSPTLTKSDRESILDALNTRLAARECITIVSYGDAVYANSEGDLYAMITGHRSSPLDAASATLKGGGAVTLETPIAAGLDSQGIDYGALNAYWDAFRRDAEDLSEIDPAPTPLNKLASTPNTTTAPTCSGLTTTAQDGERLGRLNWTPGAR